MVNHWGKGKCCQTLPQGQLEHILTEFSCKRLLLAWKTFLPEPLPWPFRREPAAPPPSQHPSCLFPLVCFSFSYYIFALIHFSYSIPPFALVFSPSFVLTCPVLFFAYLFSVAWLQFVLQFKCWYYCAHWWLLSVVGETVSQSELRAQPEGLVLVSKMLCQFYQVVKKDY